MQAIKRVNASRRSSSGTSTIERTGKVPGSETVDNILDACRESFDKLEDYFNISSDYCIFAIVLDPRFKLDFYHDPNRSDRENDDQKKEMWIKVGRVFRTNYCQDAAELDRGYTVSNVSSSRIFKKMKPTNRGDELRAYLMEYPRAGDDVDPILWWKLHSQEFPKLSKMARDYLCIASTSAPSERAFSGGILSYRFAYSFLNLLGRRLITDTRGRLSERTIRACMCLKSWL